MNGERTGDPRESRGSRSEAQPRADDLRAKRAGWRWQNGTWHRASSPSPASPSAAPSPSPPSASTSSSPLTSPPPARPVRPRPGVPRGTVGPTRAAASPGWTTQAPSGRGRSPRRRQGGAWPIGDSPGRAAEERATPLDWIDGNSEGEEEEEEREETEGALAFLLIKGGAAHEVRSFNDFEFKNKWESRTEGSAVFGLFFRAKE